MSRGWRGAPVTLQECLTVTPDRLIPPRGPLVLTRLPFRDKNRGTGGDDHGRGRSGGRKLVLMILRCVDLRIGCRYGLGLHDRHPLVNRCLRDSARQRCSSSSDPVGWSTELACHHIPPPRNEWRRYPVDRACSATRIFLFVGSTVHHPGSTIGVRQHWPDDSGQNNARQRQGRASQEQAAWKADSHYEPRNWPHVGFILLSTGNGHRV